MQGDLKDFRNFLFLCWKYLGLPDPAPLQYDIAYQIQHGPDRQLIEALRGAGKSYTLAAYVCWRLMFDPTLRILVVSASSIRAVEFIKLVRLLIEVVPELEFLKPRTNQIDGAYRFDVGPAPIAKDPSVAAYGITSMLAGTHPDIIIADDTETPDNSLTVQRREKLYQACMQFEVMLNPGGKILYLGTPQNIDSVYNKLSKSYKLTRWPAEYPDPLDEKACANVSEMILEKARSGTVKVRRGEEPGDSTYPERFPSLLLRETEGRIGRSNYWLQMLLNTNLSDANRYPLRVSDMIVYDVGDGTRAPAVIGWGRSRPVTDIESPGINVDRFYEPIFIDDKWREFDSSLMYIDPSGRGKDETGYAIGKIINGQIYVLETGGFKGGYEDETLASLARAAKKWGVKRCVIEDNFSDGMYRKCLTPIFLRIVGQAGLEDEHVTGQKEVRIIESLEAPLNTHRIVVTPAVARDEKLMTQLTHITRDRGSLDHDDRVEALAGLVRCFSDQLA